MRDPFLACRAFLASFHLPGEAQKIDRIMELFAQRFVQCNPDGKLDNSGEVLSTETVSLYLWESAMHRLITRVFKCDEVFVF